jgi:hypothetical protein
MPDVERESISCSCTYCALPAQVMSSYASASHFSQFTRGRAAKRYVLPKIDTDIPSPSLKTTQREISFLTGELFAGPTPPVGDWQLKAVDDANSRGWAPVLF